MSLSIGKRDVAKIATLIESGGFDTADDAARAVIEACFELYEDKSRWVVAGQLKYGGDAGYMDAQDERAAKVVIGPFTTQTQAMNAGSQLGFSSQTGEEFRWFAAEYWHGTPAAFYRLRNEERKKQALADKSPFEQELAKRVAWFDEHPGALVYEPDPHVGAWDRSNMPDPDDAPSFD